MSDRDLLVITGADVRTALDGREDIVVAAVAAAYLAHARGQAQTPGTQPMYSRGGRFFAMPGSIDDGQPITGMKWVASFPANVTAGVERASAVLLVNDPDSGRPVAIVDGTLISAKRTAASAALALRLIADAGSTQSLGLIGCGPINFEVLRFVLHLFPMAQVRLADLDRDRAEAFLRRVQPVFPSIAPIVTTVDEVLEHSDVVSIATNASVPYIDALPKRPLIVLHISLRDLAPDVIADCYNVVDVVDHAFTARTSLHLAAEKTGRRDFVHATIPDLLAGTTRYQPPAGPTVVSPFGLSILDLAVLREVFTHTDVLQQAVRIADFGGTVFG